MHKNGQFSITLFGIHEHRRNYTATEYEIKFTENKNLQKLNGAITRQIVIEEHKEHLQILGGKTEIGF